MIHFRANPGDLAKYPNYWYVLNNVVFGPLLSLFVASFILLKKHGIDIILAMSTRKEGRNKQREHKKLAAKTYSPMKLQAEKRKLQNQEVAKQNQYYMNQRPTVKLARLEEENLPSVET